MDSVGLHTLYGARAESENWIEQTKDSHCAGRTLTQDFWENDILWQLSAFAYTLSAIMRYRSDFGNGVKNTPLCVTGLFVFQAR